MITSHLKIPFLKLAQGCIGHGLLEKRVFFARVCAAVFVIGFLASLVFLTKNHTLPVQAVSSLFAAAAYVCLGYSYRFMP